MIWGISNGDIFNNSLPVKTNHDQQRVIRMSEVEVRAPRLLPNAKVRDRYGVSEKTLRRWEQDPNLKFPKAVWINGRKYQYEIELDAFDAARVAERDTEAA